MRYFVVGVSNVIIDFGLLNLFLYLHFNLYLSISFSFLVAATNSYFFNRNWTFQDRKDRRIGRQYAIFVLVSIVGLLLNNLLVYIFLKYIFFTSLVVTANVAKLAAIGFVTVWNYSINRFFVFRLGAPPRELAPVEPI